MVEQGDTTAQRRQQAAARTTAHPQRFAAPLARPLPQWTAAIAGFAGAVAVAIAALSVGPLPGNRPQQWWFGLPAALTRAGSGQTAMAVVFYAGTAVMVLAWLLVGLGVWAKRWRLRWLWVLAVVWALPWVVAPVALTTDIYTYLGQGLVANAGLNPYTHVPADIGLPDVLHARIAPPDQHVPTPYGPIFLGIGKALAPLAAEHVVRAILLLRLVEVLGLALAAVALPKVARKAGADPALATWLGVASPLALASGILSGHNDLLMIGLVVAALALASTDHRLAYPAAIAVCTLAALVKAPAAVGMLVLALGWLRRAPGWRAVAARLGGTVAVVGVLAVAVSLATGLGTDWVNPVAVRSPATLPPSFTPVGNIAVALHSLGIGASPEQLTHVVTVVAACLAALFVLLVLYRQPRLGEPRTIALVLAAVVLVSPVVWPWYLVWPVLLLAGTAWVRGRSVWVALAAVALFVVKPDGAPQPIGTVAAWCIALLGLAALAAGATFAYRRLLPAAQPGAPAA